MKAWRKTSILFWLLPLFAVRGLVPAGFMVDASHDRLALTICSGGTYRHHMVDAQEGAADGTAHAGHSSGHRVAPTLCSFAVASGAGPIASLPIVILTDATSVDLVADNIDRAVVRFGPIRAQQSRAPPYFS